MSDLLTGTGPQPPRVYWIRRGLVALVALVVLVLLIWALAGRGGSPGGVPSPEPSPSAASEPVVTPTPSPSGSPSASPSPSSTAPTACEPIGVQLDIAGFRSAKAGAKQTFSVTVENNTALPCVMEIRQSTFALKVASGNDPVFSTAHCPKWLPVVKKQTLKAGASVEFKLDWQTFRSAEGCKTLAGELGAGTYVATAAYRESATARFAFTLTK